MKYEYRRRFFFALVACVLFLIAFLFLRTDTATTSICGAVGCGIGLILGRITWSEIRKKIDKNNFVIFYFADTAAYAILLLAFFISTAPRPIFQLTDLAIRYPMVFGAVVICSMAVSVGYNIALLVLVRRHELLMGPLLVRRLYAPSVVGTQGMIEKKALVIRSCKPRGTVQVGPEIWNAVTADGSTIRKGNPVIIKEVVGLQLRVEAVPSSVK